MTSINEKAIYDLNKIIEKKEDTEKKAIDIGIEIGNALLDNLKTIPIEIYHSNFKSIALANFIKTALSDEPDIDCKMLLLEWTFNRYWGEIIYESISKFKSIHNELMKIHATRNDRLVWGDIDCSAWAEIIDDHKIIGSEIYCSCKEDNTYLYILSENISCGEPMIDYHCRTLWPKETRLNMNWGNKKSDLWIGVKHPSYHTYKRSKFKLKYKDIRDIGYVWSNNWPKNNEVECGEYNQYEIYTGLKHLYNIRLGLEHPYELPKNKKC